MIQSIQYHQIFIQEALSKNAYIIMIEDFVDANVQCRNYV